MLVNVAHWFFPHYCKTNVFAFGGGVGERLVYMISSLPVSILLVPAICFNIMSHSPGPLSGFLFHFTEQIWVFSNIPELLL